MTHHIVHVLVAFHPGGVGAVQHDGHHLLALPRHRGRARLLVGTRMSAAVKGVVDRDEAGGMVVAVAAFLAALVDAAVVVVVARIGAVDLQGLGK